MSRIQYVITLIGAVMLFSCSGSDTRSDDNSKNGNSSEISETGVDIDEEVTDTTTNSLNLKGYIGDSPVSVFLRVMTSGSGISGYYYYDKYKKNIRLEGEQTEWYGGPVYTISELDKNGEVTATWDSFSQWNSGVYKGTFIAKDSESGFPIDLLDVESHGFLHRESKMLFLSAAEAEKFFKNHHFLNNETEGKSGIIMMDHPENYDYEAGVMLPEGLTFYQHDGGDGFGVERTGQINGEGDLGFDDGSTVTWDEFGLDWIETGYELRTARFNELVDPEFVLLSGTGYNRIFLEIKELVDAGYHLEGDGNWIRGKSGSVLGFYPLDPLPIYKDATVKSKVLVTIDNEDGFFSLIDTKMVEGECWAEVRYEYYTEIPCTSETRPAKKPINGWVKLYQYDDKNYRNQLILDYYSRGC